MALEGVNFDMNANNQSNPDPSFPISRKDIESVSAKGQEELSSFVRAVLSAQLNEELIDYDRLVAFGISCGSIAKGLDRVAIDWASNGGNDAHLDIALGFLMGYWDHKPQIETVSAELLELILDLRDRVQLGEDSITASVDVVAGVLSSSAIDAISRLRIAARLKSYTDAEKDVPHTPRTLEMIARYLD